MNGTYEHLTSTEIHLIRVKFRRERAYLRWRMLRAHPTEALRAWGWVVGWDRAWHALAITTGFLVHSAPQPERCLCQSVGGTYGAGCLVCDDTGIVPRDTGRLSSPREPKLQNIPACRGRLFKSRFP